MNYNYPVLIVIYNPDTDLLIRNVKAVLSAGAEEILLVDNCDDYSFDLNKLKGVGLESISHIWNGKNIGIASALNIGCSYYYEKGYKWVLTLDQDSVIPWNLFEVYQRFLSNSNDKVAMLSCNHSEKKNADDNIFKHEFKNLCITSGCLLNLTAWNQVGRFDEKLFIDGVDHDMCIKLRLNNFNIVYFPNLCMNHNLGNPRVINILGRKFNVRVGHSPVRMFYMTRNWNYLDNKYKIILSNQTGLNLSYSKIIFVILLFERSKLSFLTSLFMGYHDFKKGIFRTFNEMRESNSILKWLLK